MKRFQFRLEQVLRLRKGAEDEARISLGRAVSELNAVIAQIKAVTATKVQAEKERFAGNPGAATIMIYTQYITRLDNEIVRLNEAREEDEKAVDKARDVFIDARRERLRLDNLRSKQLAEFRKEQKRAENKANDDVNAGAKARAAL
jgi:flagellar FliJ protein